MTPQTALEILQDTYYCGHLPFKVKAAVEEAIGALEKRTPQKLENSYSGMYYVCPSCRRFIDKNEHAHGNINIPFCKWCGQAFDWSDDNG